MDQRAEHVFEWFTGTACSAANPLRTEKPALVGHFLPIDASQEIYADGDGAVVFIR
jgi:hypothetical protein